MPGNTFVQPKWRLPITWIRTPASFFPLQSTRSRGLAVFFPFSKLQSYIYFIQWLLSWSVSIVWVKRMKRQYKMFGNRRDKKSLIPVQASPSWASQHSDQVRSPDRRQTPQSFKPSLVSQSRKSHPLKSQNQRQTSPQSFKPYEVGFKVIFI